MAVDAVCAHLMFTTHLHTDDCQRNERIMHSSIRNTNESFTRFEKTDESFTRRFDIKKRKNINDKCSNVTLDKWAKHFIQNNRV